MRLDLGFHRLEVNPDPFAIAVWLGDQKLFQTQPHPETLIKLDANNGIVRAVFAASTLTLTPTPDSITVRWQSPNLEHKLLFSGFCYGLGELIHQLWPLNRARLPEAEFLTSDNGSTGLSCILNPTLLSSEGVAIVVQSPVRLGFNPPSASYPRYPWGLGNSGPFEHRPFAEPSEIGDGLLILTGNDLSYDIVLADNLPVLYQTLVSRFLWHPSNIPPADLFTRPTWTTWARYKTDVNQKRVLDFAQEILAHGYPYHVLEIDDRWQVHYGDLNFDPERFPDPKGMVTRLHEMGFKVTAWVIPFLDPQSQAFAEGARHKYLVCTPNGEPCLVPWWQGWGGLLDVSNPAALDWFLARLQALQEASGLDGFKFDAGEAIFVPANAVTHERIQPNDYSHRYVEFVARHFDVCEVRSGWMNQTAPIFFRQWDKTTQWGLDNGLQSVITGILSLSLAGYPFVLPDMIGGNAYNEVAEAELMIRWTQLNALLPAMQFSLAPWDYGSECDELCRRYANLHIEFAPRILQLAESAAHTGQPLIRPLFWLAPHDKRALLCDDQFLLGDDLMIAPVVRLGGRSRNIYFPPGLWRDHWTGHHIQGPLMALSYQVPLDTLPIFQRV